MPKFDYVALDAKGTETSGMLEAENTVAAINQLKEQGFFPTSVVQMGKAKRKKGGAKGQGLNIELSFLNTGKVKSKVLTAFTRQLATLIDAGLPLLRGLMVLQNQEKNPVLKRVIGECADSVQGGATFSEALAQHPKVYNKLFVNMVKAGEIGGVLEVVLNRLAEFQEKAEKIRGKVKSAMIYPVIVLTLAVSITIGLMIFIVPRFKEIFEDLLEGEPMPALTQFVMNVSDVVRQHFVFVAIGIAALVIAIKMIAKTKGGKKVFDTLKLNSPIFGPLIRKVSIARFSRTLGTLMSSGVPVLQALNIVRETTGNEVVAEAVGSVHDAIKEGESMAQPLGQSKVFPPMVVSMIDVGEETGALPEMLMRVADNYEEEVDNAVAGLTSLIEPIMIVLLALVVGSIVIALFLPLITIIEKLGGS